MYAIRSYYEAPFMKLKPNEQAEALEVRCRTIGDITNTGLVLSKATTIEDIVMEIAVTRTTERGIVSLRIMYAIRSYYVFNPFTQCPPAPSEPTGSPACRLCLRRRDGLREIPI